MTNTSSTLEFQLGLIGSCLSAIPAEKLAARFGCRQVFRVFHNRSDQIRAYYLDKTWRQMPIEWAVEQLRPLPAYASDLRTILENQYEPFIGFQGPLQGTNVDVKGFGAAIAEATVDIILLDNFMDVAARLLHARRDYVDCGPVFFPTHMADLEQTLSYFELDPYLEPEASAQNWLEIVNYLQRAHPLSTIYFLCWSHSTSRNQPERLARIVEFHRCFAGPASEIGVRVIAPIDVPEELTGGADDWYHLHDSVYEAIAGHIYLDFVSRLRSRWRGSPRDL